MKRFDVDMCGYMEPCESGDWVNGDEAEVEIAKRDARIKELEMQIAFDHIMFAEQAVRFEEALRASAALGERITALEAQAFRSGK